MLAARVLENVSFLSPLWYAFFAHCCWAHSLTKTHLYWAIPVCSGMSSSCLRNAIKSNHLLVISPIQVGRPKSPFVGDVLSTFCGVLWTSQLLHDTPFWLRCFLPQTPLLFQAECDCLMLMVSYIHLLLQSLLQNRMQGYLTRHINRFIP